MNAIPKVVILNRDQLNDIIISHLYALSILDDDEEVLDLEIEEITLDDATLILWMSK